MQWPWQTAVMIGAIPILFGTVLYWPLERLVDWQAKQDMFAREAWFRSGYRFTLAIRNGPWLRRAYRSALIVGGTAIIVASLL